MDRVCNILTHSMLLARGWISGGGVFEVMYDKINVKSHATKRIGREALDVGLGGWVAFVMHSPRCLICVVGERMFAYLI